MAVDYINHTVKPIQLADPGYVLLQNASDRMHGMIQMEARLFISLFLFRFACLPN